MTILPSTESADVFWCPEGTDIDSHTLNSGWYFWDETGMLGGGPYSTERQALSELIKYAEELSYGQT